ncbi:coiled-coil domain-containing protein 12-like [Daphnia carinata]|uniref:coiled-coil domain-containing protein 12-like n=1 Tax=Daphnia carinata TaxID=120202 RepID=UPI00257F78AA|nr:coiled-coil domain-containing protein 12-like [Daphnia carinata]XP_059351328.1 coiled-coil domain-containing protein 12-like [Daphnia carinata]
MEDETLAAREQEEAANLENEALKRKKRIEALRQLKEQQEQTRQSSTESQQQSLPRPVFRSYRPLDEELKKSSVPLAEPEEVDQHITKELGKAADPPVLEEIDLVNLAPRKPDWDLKRDVAKKLAKLEKRTQRAIAVLIRERLMETKQDDLAAAVNALN